MTISKLQKGEKTVFALSGRLDAITSPQLQETLIPEFDLSKNIELDLSALDYISSAGLRVLLLGKKTATANSASFSVSNVSEEILKLFEMTGFTSFLTIN